MTLSDYLVSVTPLPTRLSLVHCTTVGRGIGLLESGELKPTPCPVYGTDLLYLFYGRPAYKPAAGAGASGILDHAPICLVLDPVLLDAAQKAVPFDSGGFDRYRPLIGLDLDRPAFELGAGSDLPLRLVHAFYQSNRNYYDQSPAVREPDIPISKRAARALARLIADPAMRQMDDRCGTIELHFSSAVSLASALQAIVAPSAMLDDADVQAALSLCPGAVPLPYKTYGRAEPLSFAHTIYERVDTFLEARDAFV